MAVGVGATDDGGEMGHGRTRQAKFFNHPVKGRPFPDMGPEDILDIEGNRAKARGHAFDLARGHEQKHGIGIDEAADEPWTGDPVDLGPRTGYPERGLSKAKGRQMIGSDKHAVLVTPCLEATFQRLGINSGMTQPRRNALRETASKYQG